jgi:hypothetical protein
MFFLKPLQHVLSMKILNILAFSLSKHLSLNTNLVIDYKQSNLYENYV